MSRLKLVLLIVEGYLYLALVVAIFLSVPAFLVWGLLARRPFVAVVAILVGVPVAMTAGRVLRALWLVPTGPAFSIAWNTRPTFPTPMPP